jgi:triphosphatase
LEIEIEMKLLVADGADKIIQQQLLPTLSATVESCKLVLANDYYDSPMRSLRKHDIGFRIRTNQGSIEQTLKTRGTTMGGVHQRPEYNIELEQAQPQLSLFAKEVWPQELNVAELQTQLCLMFSTNFTRHLYLLTLADGSQIELVWDKGEITSQQQTLPVCELELELKNGKAEHLFSLARSIAKLMPLKIGNASKAARGYALVDGLKTALLPLPDTLTRAENDNIETGFMQAMECALAHWQHHEALYHGQASASALTAMCKGMELLLTSLNVYQQELYWDALPALQAALTDCLDRWRWVKTLGHFEQVISDTNPLTNSAILAPLRTHFNEKSAALLAQHQPHCLFSDPKHVLLQLDIAQMLFIKPWRARSKGYLLSKQVFAKQVLLSNESPSVSKDTADSPWLAEDYIGHGPEIEYQQSLAFLFAPVLRPSPHTKQAPWAALEDGLEQLHLLAVLQEEVLTLELEEKERILSLCSEQITRVLESMEDSRGKTSSSSC